MSTIPECLRKLGVRELSDEEYKEILQGRSAICL